MTKLQLGVNEVNNAEYHGDKSWLSSSSLKLLLKDVSKFHKEYILQERAEKEEKSAYDEGSLTHAMILEPHNISSDFAFFPGFVKRGPEFNAFKESEEARGKTIISEAQKNRCEDFLYAFKKNKAAKQILLGGHPEHTVCANYRDMNIKVRCDYINLDEGYIVDVKTTAFPTEPDSFKNTISMYDYDLSAYLYAHISSLHYNKKFDFYFVVIDKKNLVCDVYKASEKMMIIGKTKVEQAIDIYKKCKETGIWKKELLKPKNLTSVTDYEIVEI